MNELSVTKVVILARGLGTRMRKADDAADLDPDQAAAAEGGAKAMMPIGRPFLDHCLSAYADAGLVDACLVIGPEHQAVRDYYDSLEMGRVRVSYAVQDEPLGTANAVLAAEEFVSEDRFVMVNGDNFYPTEALAELVQAPDNATVGFEPEAMIEQSNIPADRIASFALLDQDADGNLADIVEKPTPEQLAARRETDLVSMNCFCFTPAIFDACRTIPRSARGEFEIVDAVRALVTDGHAVKVVPVSAGVLDMASRHDVAAVEAVLRDRPVRL